MTPTFEHKLKVLFAYGFTVGLRDVRFNTDHRGHYMVVEGTIAEIESDYEVPFSDGRNGPWCVVGDDLTALVDQAFDVASMFDNFDTTLADIQAGGVGLLHTDGTGAGPIVRE